MTPPTLSVRQLDRVARAGLAAGILTILQPWWQHGLRAGFFLTAAATLLHIVTSHLLARNPERGP